MLCFPFIYMTTIFKLLNEGKEIKRPAKQKYIHPFPNPRMPKDRQKQNKLLQVPHLRILIQATHTHRRVDGLLRLGTEARVPHDQDQDQGASFSQ